MAPRPSARRPLSNWGRRAPQSSAVTAAPRLALPAAGARSGGDRPTRVCGSEGAFEVAAPALGSRCHLGQARYPCRLARLRVVAHLVFLPLIFSLTPGGLRELDAIRAQPGARTFIVGRANSPSSVLLSNIVRLATGALQRGLPSWAVPARGLSRPMFPHARIDPTDPTLFEVKCSGS